MPFVVCCALVYFWTLRFSRIGDFYTLRLGFFGNLDLRIIFVLSAYSGIELHVADYEGNHEVWHNWAVFHVLTSLLFLMASIIHIATHWGWYKGTAKNGIGRKSKVTAVLSVLFLSVVLTGFALLGIEGAGSPVGQCHFWAGIVTTVLSIGHILKRLPLLRKSLK